MPRTIKAVFNYPAEFVTLPEHTAHSGQTVEIVRALTPAEADFHADPDLERMFKVRAADGWEGDAFETELELTGDATEADLEALVAAAK